MKSVQLQSSGLQVLSFCLGFKRGPGGLGAGKGLPQGPGLRFRIREVFSFAFAPFRLRLGISAG